MRSFESCYRSRPDRRQRGATRGKGGGAAEAALEGLGAAVDLCQRMGIEKEETEWIHQFWLSAHQLVPGRTCIHSAYQNEHVVCGSAYLRAVRATLAVS